MNFWICFPNSSVDVCIMKRPEKNQVKIPMIRIISSTSSSCWNNFSSIPFLSGHQLNKIAQVRVHHRKVENYTYSLKKNSYKSNNIDIALIRSNKKRKKNRRVYVKTIVNPTGSRFWHNDAFSASLQKWHKMTVSSLRSKSRSFGAYFSAAPDFSLRRNHSWCRDWEEQQARGDEGDSIEVEAMFAWSPTLSSLGAMSPPSIQMHDRYPRKIIRFASKHPINISELRSPKRPQ